MQTKDLESLLYTAIKYKSAYYGICPVRGWVNINDLIDRINFLECKSVLNKSKIYKIAKRNPKFTINFWGTKIRANKIHSGSDLMLRKSIPPTLLFIVTDKPLKTGADKSIIPLDGTEYIKLTDKLPPKIEPSRVLVVNSEQMCVAGYPFFTSNTEEWYVTKIPVRFVSKFVPKF